MEIKIELLDRSHDREGFDCGVDALNIFLKTHSLQNQKNHISKTFVAVENHRGHKTSKDVLGFYTLSTGQLHFDDLPKKLKHPKYPVSIARLARLATDLRYQGQGIGGFLLHDALQKIKTASNIVGIFAIVVDAKDETAKNFYEHYGFLPLQDVELTLCLPVKLLDKL